MGFRNLVIHISPISSTDQKATAFRAIEVGWRRQDWGPNKPRDFADRIPLVNEHLENTQTLRMSHRLEPFRGLAQLLVVHQPFFTLRFHQPAFFVAFPPDATYYRRADLRILQPERI